MYRKEETLDELEINRVKVMGKFKFAHEPHKCTFPVLMTFHVRNTAFPMGEERSGHVS